MNRKTFHIGVGWNPISGKHDHQLSLLSTTLVLDAGNDYVKPPFEIERVSGSWSPHIPEKKPRYRVTWEDYRRDTTFETDPMPLANVRVGRDILVVVPALRKQTCLNLNGSRHGIYYNRDARSPRTYCGESPHLPLGSDPTMDFTQMAEPTCKVCLAYKSVWCLYTVFPYQHKNEVIKRIKKEKTEAEKRLRLPTAYARILDDDLFENPTYKPVKVRVAPSEPDDDEYVDPRDRIRASAIERNRRLEESKATIRGHRR